MQMVYGRVDGTEEEAVPPGELVPQFDGVPHERVETPPPVQGGEEGKEGGLGDEGGEGGEGGGGGKEAEAPKPKVQLVERLSRLGLTPAQQVRGLGFRV
jgi:hypothetical protein